MCAVICAVHAVDSCSCQLPCYLPVCLEATFVFIKATSLNLPACLFVFMFARGPVLELRHIITSDNMVFHFSL